MGTLVIDNLDSDVGLVVKVSDLRKIVEGNSYTDIEKAKVSIAITQQDMLNYFLSAGFGASIPTVASVTGSIYNDQGTLRVSP